MINETTAAESRDRAPGSPLKTALKVALGLAALVALVLIGRQAGGIVPRFAETVQGLGVWAPVVFILGYAVATVAFLPGSILTLAAGIVFGLAWGTLWAFLGATLGAAGAFLVARYVARGAVERRLEGRPKFQAIDRAVGKEGWKLVALLRLSPVLPFNLLNYALGLTKVSFGGYVLACLAMLPGTLLYVYYGTLLGDLAALAAGAEVERGAEGWILFAAGLLATVVATYVLTRRAKKALAEDVEGGAEAAHD